LVVQHTSGAPGRPARLRLRGPASVNESNDPIVIVDGVRVYAEQSGARDKNLASFSTQYAAPSPLDYLDPHSIETIEVLKGPSAATMYGSDAANGVIVITTKRGKSGPPQWTASLERGTTALPGKWPNTYVRWGRNPLDNEQVFCGLVDELTTACRPDSLVAYQLLNDPSMTVLGHGWRSGITLGVSGGSDALTYAVNGNYSEEMGLIRLPAFEAQRYRTSHGGEPPEWMRRPQRLKQWGAQSRIGARIGQTANVSLTSMLSRSEQQRSSLEQQIGTLMRSYVDHASGIYYTPFVVGTHVEGLMPNDIILNDYFQRATDVATQFTNGVNLNWTTRPWLQVSADVGLNVVERTDGTLLPNGAKSPTDSGQVSMGRGESIMKTVNVRATATAPLPWGIRLQLASGVNYTDRSTSDFAILKSHLAYGGESIQNATKIESTTGLTQDQATFGWYIEPSFSRKRLWLSTGLRLDGGNAFGSSAHLTALPKISLSYLLSDEPFFPDALKPVFNTLRLRAAYGMAGVQPGPTDRLRLYGVSAGQWYDGQFVDAAHLSNVGNSEIRPERSRELEGGFDADMFDDRISLGFTGYRKTRIDALVSFKLPPSVLGDGGTILRNIGVIRNLGYELTLGAQLLRTDPVSWRVQGQVSHNTNTVVTLNQGIPSYRTPSGSATVGVVPGYPLFGLWGPQILGYSDRNGDGVIDPASELLVSDTLVYLGSQNPDYEGSVSTTLSLFRSAVTLSATFLYVGGLTQTGLGTTFSALALAANDPAAPLDAKAAAVAQNSVAGFVGTQTVSTWRLNSLSVAYNVPTRVAQRLGAQALSVALQGTNLWLHTNYRGMDPNVNAFATGNSIADTGILPQPRTWSIRVRASY
ncbi:MAG: TonB-dependent receptor, partial [Gemmatimonadaceae bacterium]|nr:TonB-dependent receptor [Gemmatimonadaceae bacterium]